MINTVVPLLIYISRNLGPTLLHIPEEVLSFWKDLQFKTLFLVFIRPAVTFLCFIGFYLFTYPDTTTTKSMMFHMFLR